MSNLKLINLENEVTNDKDRKAAFSEIYSEQEMNDTEATRNYCKNTVFVDETGNDEAMVYNMRAMAFVAGIQHARSQERERLKRFREHIRSYPWGATDIDFIIDEFLEQEANARK